MTRPAINLHLGQHVTVVSRYIAPGATGKIERLGIDYSGDRQNTPVATVLLDKPEERPEFKLSDGTVLRAYTNYRITVGLDEVVPYDFRDAAISSLRDCVDLLATLAPESWQHKAAREMLEKLGDLSVPA